MGRIAALLGVGVIVSLVVALVSRAGGEDESARRGSRDSESKLMSNLGFTIVVPIVALVFASAAFGDLKEDGTLVYLWLRPMDRWPMVVGGWLASVTVSLAGDSGSLDGGGVHRRRWF